MFHGRNDLGHRVVDGVDLVIDFATLGEYGLEQIRAEGPARQRTDRRPRPDRRPGWEAPARAPRSACGAASDVTVIGARTLAESRGGDAHPDWGFPRLRPSRVDFRGALERYAT